MVESPNSPRNPVSKPLKVLILGGTGLLGLHCVREALAHGHSVTVLARNPATFALPDGVGFLASDISRASDEDLSRIFEGQDAVIYGLGLDDRQSYKRPAYNAFHADHVDTCLRVLRTARARGVRKFVVFGSYFTHFDIVEPSFGLSRNHPYIRTRREQRDAVLAEATPSFNTFVFELPYIIGSMPGRVPPWTFLVELLAGKGRSAWFFSKGGTAAVTARQVAWAAMGAIETAKSGAYALGGKNYSWTEMAKAILSALGNDKRLNHLSKGMFAFFGWLSTIPGLLIGEQKGLSVFKFARFHYSDAFVDPEPSMSTLNYRHDDYQAAMREMIDEWKMTKHRS